MSQLTSQFFLENNGQVLKVKTCGKKTTYLLSTSTIVAVGAKAWSRQRPTDDARVDEIRKGIEEAADVQGIISMAWHPKEGMIVYDGQHRWKALCGIQNDTIKAIIEVMWDATDDEIMKAFVTINQCVPVSDLYMQPNIVDAVDIRSQIEDYVKYMITEYPEFVSAKKPNRPNFNRDHFADELYKIWADIFEKHSAFEDICSAIARLNEEYDTNQLSVPRNILKSNAKMLQKCVKGGLWLFAESGRINIDHLKSKM